MIRLGHYTSYDITNLSDLVRECEIMNTFALSCRWWDAARVLIIGPGNAKLLSRWWEAARLPQRLLP